MEPESLTHLFYHCAKSFDFWTQLEQYIVCKIKINILIDCKSVLMTFVHGKHDITYITNLFILYGKFHILKCKYSKTSPNFRSFLHEFKEYMKSLSLIETKQSITSTDIYQSFFKEESFLLCFPELVCHLIYVFIFLSTFHCWFIVNTIHILMNS